MTGKSRWEEKEERLYHRKLHGMNSTKETKKEVVTTVRKEEVTEEEAIVREIGLEEPIEDNVFEETYTRTKTSEKVVEEEAVREVKPENKKNKDERELHECILAAYKNGIKNKSEIARKCKCSRQTVYRIAEKVWY